MGTVIRKLQLVAIALLVFGSVSAVFAQYEEERPSKYGIRAMSFMPMGGKLQDQSSLWYGAGIDYYLSKDEEERPTRYITLTFLGSGDGRDRSSMNSLTYGRIKRTPISDSRTRYTAFGAGIYNLKYHDESPGMFGGLIITDESTFKPGIYGVYGQEFNDAYFIELRVDLLPEWQDTSWIGVGLTLGTRISL